MNGRLHRALSVMVIVSMLLSVAGCGKGQPAAITPVPTLEGASVLPTRTSPPAPTAEPTLAPLPPVPPRLTGTAPARGEEQRLDQPLVLRFDQPMDKASVERAFQIAPRVEGALVWEDPETLEFVPAQPLERGAEYTVTLAEGIASAQGLASQQAFSFRFSTVGTLLVTDVYPQPGSQDVATQGAIRVAFNRPVVPLTFVRDQENLPDPLTFAPAVAGKGEWINTSIYSYQPSEPLVPGTGYTVTVPAGLADTTGGLLEEDYTWSFVTELPRVAEVLPGDGARHVPADAAVRIVFSQAMNGPATEERVRLWDAAGKPVSGAFSWEGNTLLFRPLQPLTTGETYRLTVDAGAPAASGAATLPEPWASTFTVLAEPRVLSFTPEGQQVDPGQGLEITFSAPISTETLLKGLIIEPKAQAQAWWREDETIAYVSTYLEPSTVYTVTLTTDILAANGDPLVEKASFTFRTRAFQPSFYLDVPSQVTAYNAYAKPTVLVKAVNVQTLDLALYTISPEDFMSLNTSDSWRRWQAFRPDPRQLVNRWSVKPEADLNVEARVVQGLTYPDDTPLEPGLYFLNVSSPQARDAQRHLLVVTHLNVTVKSSATETLAWVTDLQSGQPLADVSLEVYGETTDLHAQATTDREGVATVTHAQQEPWSSLFVLAREGDAVTVHMKNWSRGIEPWNFQLTYDPYVQRYRAMLYTDRQIYRPGQTVYFRAVIRTDDDGAYSLPPIGGKSMATLTLTDPEGRDLYTEALPLSDMGTVSDQFLLDAEAATGYYRLLMEYGGLYSEVYFSVAEYRKPEFEVTVSLGADEYIQGDTITLAAQASYYFGGPVANADVRWSVVQTPWYFDRWQGDRYYSFSDYDYEARWSAPGANLVTEGKGKTDAQGRFVTEVPADIADQIQSQVLSLEVSVVDVNNQQVSGRAPAIVHRGTFYIGVSPLSYVGTVGEPQRVALITVDTQGITRTAQSLTATLLKREWLSVREEADDGRFYWTNKIRETAVATETVTTDLAGLAEVTFRPTEGGSYRVRVTGLDERENQVRSSAYLWVSDRAFINWGRENADSIDLIADKDLYAPGDVATVLIPSPYEGDVQALLTIERGHVFEHRLFTLASNSEQIEIPIMPAYAPNVYVSVTIVQGMSKSSPVPSIKVGYVKLSVSTEERELAISITPDRSGPYQPRDKATLAIEVTDHRGKGVEAELSLKMVDRAVEALTGGDPTNIVDAFYRERSLGVATGSTLTALMDRYLLVVMPEGKGGGGGAGAAAGPMVRSEFADTAFWEAAVRTDKDGRAAVTVSLPDNLTTWHIAAQAVTADTLVGRADAYIVSTLDLLIRPVAPRFLIIGDEPILGAVVHNNTDKDLRLTASLEADGLTIAGGPQALTVAAGERETLAWPATVGQVESTTLRYAVSGGGKADAINITLPVYHATSPEVVGTAGQVEDSILELVRLPAGAEKSQGDLTVYLEPSLAAGMRESLTYLKSYPYECVEQTVSRFLPNVVTYRALQQLGVDRPDLEELLPDLVSTALQRLYRGQNLDGGWGWWPGGRSSPLITAYVVLGMSEARAAGFTVDAASLQSAVAWLQSWLGTKTPADEEAGPDLRATVLYSLAEAGAGDLGRTVALYDDARHDMSLYAKAYLAMTLAILDPQEATRLATLTNEFANAAVLSASGAHWEEATVLPGAMNTDVRTSALVLRALGRIAPDSALLPNAVRWLMTVRQNGRWSTTQENAWSIMALTEYMVMTGELQGEYEFALSVNGTEVTSGQVTPATVDEVVTQTVPIADLRRLGDNQLLMERTEGPGKLYYSAFLRYFLPADQMRELNRGLIVTREYLAVAGDGKTSPITEARVNDEIQVKLTIIAPHSVNFLVFEDPLPAGCEAVDVSLATTSQTASGPQLEKEGAEQQPGDPWWWYRWAWPSHTEIRDEKVALFADYLEAGTYEYTYTMRATTPGAYQVLPTVAYEMYFPDVFGRSAGAIFRITE
ncbi:MAG: hypothetical protein GX657_06840 [Chloroflexi bacterium]|nr:hypothetical protein [Chloroflexota bacterium]